MLDTRLEDSISQNRAHPENDLVTFETNVHQRKLLEPKPSEPKPSRVQRLVRRSKLTASQIRNMLLQAPHAPMTEPDISLARYRETISQVEQGSPQTKLEPYTAVPELN